MRREVDQMKYRMKEELPFSLNVEDVAELLGISRVSAYNLCHTVTFPAVRVGKRIVIPTEKFLEWLNSLPKAE